jgi:hypothetical protein
MKRTLYLFAALIALLALAACGGKGGSASTRPAVQEPAIPPASERNTVSLTQEYTTSGGEGRLEVTLAAQSMLDLYQIAGTLRYDESSLQLERVSQGSFLGDPAEVVFFQRAEGGRLAFALTKRRIEPGAIGNGVLLRARFRVLTNQLPEEPVALEEDLRARDSLRHRIELRRGGAK